MPIKKYNFIGQKLIEWYKINKRDLPWRDTIDPYKIWISEIILQQTRVSQGVQYYRRFINRFPNINSLVKASEQEVLIYWQGLGYYSRARNLHITAKIISKLYNEIFPKSYQLLIQLKGIGEYTAAAIVSFAWNMPYPVVDGNVFRFLSRLFSIDCPTNTRKGKMYFMQIATKLMSNISNPGIFNQAIMEFGALQCTNSNPNCNICPFVYICLAFLNCSVNQYPVKQLKKNSTDLYLYYFHINDLEHLYLYSRRKRGIWQNLFEFPVIESKIPLTLQQLITTKSFKRWFSEKKSYHFDPIEKTQKHLLSHRILHAFFYKIHIKSYQILSNELVRIKKTEIKNFPIHKLIQTYLDEI